MTSSQGSTLNPKSIKTRFAYRFLRSLKKLKNKTSSSSLSRPCSRNIHRRCRMVKTAAYASMASAVGARRAWSRAMLWKNRNRRLNNNHINSFVSIIRGKRRRSSGESAGGGNPNLGDLYRAEELRRLVPGGETMDMCSLLGETAHYIKCLTTQIQVMRNIVNYYSTC